MTSFPSLHFTDSTFTPGDKTIAGLAVTKSLREPLKQRYFTPTEGAIPIRKESGNLAPHSPLAIQKSKPIVSTVVDEQHSILDGFYLLEATGLAFPEDIQEVILSDKGLRGVVADDLSFFSEILYMDLSENSLDLFPFGAIPKLRELRLACNNITKFPKLLGFHSLLYLDLSYNRIAKYSIQALDVLPNLKELDLSGNNLKSLPPDMYRFESLEKLVLDYNKIDDNGIFESLGSVPNLRHLGLSNNYLSIFSARACEDNNFRLLEFLDISFNYFGQDEDIENATRLPRMISIMLYGNPILGPTGEDPMFIYIDDLVDRANDYRDSTGTQLPYIDFNTEIPKKRVLKKGEPLGRLAAYRDFAIVQVDGTISDKTSRQWRQQGQRTLFAELMAARKQVPSSSTGPPSPTALPDFTFLTNSVLPQNPAATSTRGSYEFGKTAARNPDGDKTVDNVMQKVADDMGLVSSADLIRLRDQTKMPTTVMVKEEEEAAKRKIQEIQEDSILPWLFLSPPGSALDPDAVHQHHSSLISTYPLPRRTVGAPAPPAHGEGDELRPEDRLPEGLFNDPLGDTGALTAQPVALNTAIKALKLALKQPLTDYNEVPSKPDQETKKLTRPTKASVIRQQPRRRRLSNIEEGNTNLSSTLPVPKAATLPYPTTTGSVVSGHDILDKASQKYNRRGLAEAAAVKKTRQHNRDHTLHQIEEVLNNLNERTGLLESERVSNFNVNPGITGTREEINRMQTFARPATGVKQLMDMVDNVLLEFGHR